jgi:hypothetical protein
MVPASENEQFIKKLSLLDPTALKVFVEPGAGHKLTDVMKSQTVEWLRLHLCTSSHRPSQ